jgi:hypothetical protein
LLSLHREDTFVGPSEGFPEETVHGHVLRGSGRVFRCGYSPVVSVDVFEAEVRVEVFGEVEGAYQFVKDTSLVINLMGHCELGGAELGVREQHSDKSIDSSLLN